MAANAFQKIISNATTKEHINQEEKEVEGQPEDGFFDNWESSEDTDSEDDDRYVSHLEKEV